MYSTDDLPSVFVQGLEGLCLVVSGTAAGPDNHLTAAACAKLFSDPVARTPPAVILIRVNGRIPTPMKRTVIYISDGTAITAQKLGHSLITQFPGIDFEQIRMPFVDDEIKCRSAVQEINRFSSEDGQAALVFTTFVQPHLTEVIRESQGDIIDLFYPFIRPLERSLSVPHEPTIGMAHGLRNKTRYEDRIDATHYAMSHDDGINLDFDDADLILLGVSRSGKTPTCLYMALHFGVQAANYPLTPRDLDEVRLPSQLRQHKHKLAGLTIDPERLSQIRQTRKPDSRYASLRQCRREVESAESLLRLEGVPVFSVTHASIEEIASRILLKLGMHRPMY
jgi:regulator of PEP synthase PpsR (kinase-PPPase family)